MFIYDRTLYLNSMRLCNCETFISLIDASVSTENDVSQLPLRDETPPREASVAADSVEAVLEP